MSFFLKGKKLHNAKRAKYSNDKTKKKRPDKPSKLDEEITSSEDEGLEEINGEHFESSDDETAQDKKLRLAKVYLEEIERVEKEKLEDKELDKEVISRRLRDDYLKQAGKLKTSVAHKYENIDKSNIKILKCRVQRNSLTCICVTSDDKVLFSGSKDGVVVKWSLTENKKLGVIPFVKSNTEKILGHSHKIISIAISSDAKFLAVGDESKDVQIWNPETLEHINTLKGHKMSITGLCFKKETHTLYSCSKDRSVRVWSLDEMAFVETLFGHQDCITSIDTLYRDRVLTSGGRDTTLRIWKITEESQLIYNGHAGSIDCVKLINEEHFVSGGDDGQLCIWSSMKKKPLCAAKEAHGCDPRNQQPYWITCVTSLLNTDLIASGSQDGFVKVWKLGPGFRTIEPLFDIPVNGFVNSLTFTSDGKKLIIAVSQEHRFGRWSVNKTARNSIFVIPLIINET